MTNNQRNPLQVMIPVSLGELIDKITILEIKRKYLNDIKLQNVLNELSGLEKILENIIQHLKNM